MAITRETDVSGLVGTVATGVWNLIDSGHKNRGNAEDRVQSVICCKFLGIH